MRLCVTGRHGQVASALIEAGAAEGVEIVPLARPEFDLAQADDIAGHLARIRPDVLVSAAAFTAVDAAETAIAEAEALNTGAPGILAAASAALDIPVLHLSTDYVFDGRKDTPYIETDATGPTSVYGRSKLAGEQRLAVANPRHVILRTAWVYSHEGQNFLRTMLRLAETRDSVAVVEDQTGCPTYAPDIAAALIAIARQIVVAEPGAARFGIFNMAGGGATDWASFAEAIFAAARSFDMPSARVRRIPSAEYPTPVRRPANSRLDGTKIAQTFGVRLPDWQDGLRRCMARLAARSDDGRT